MCKSLQTMTRYKPGKKSVTAEDQQKHVNEQNAFYARFDDTDISAKQSATLEEVDKRKADCAVFTTEEVSNCFQKVDPRCSCQHIRCCPVTLLQFSYPGLHAALPAVHGHVSGRHQLLSPSPKSPPLEH